jgi:hypothetical protein
MRSRSFPVARQDVAAFLTQGVSLIAVTRDDRMVVESVRCAVARLDGERRVQVAIPLPEGKRTLANIELTGVIALSAALPSNYQTVQLKGRDARRVEWPELAELAALHRQRFAAVLTQMGSQPEVVNLLWSQEYEAIVFTADEMYDQTPGPEAGLALAP